MEVRQIGEVECGMRGIGNKREQRVVYIKKKKPGTISLWLEHKVARDLR